MSLVDDKVAEAASRLRDAHRSGVACSPVADLLGTGDIALAYAAQNVNTRLAIESGRRLVGRKIGLTSPAVQKQLGVDQPDYGVLFADMNVLDGGAIAPDALIQPKVEAEVAFVLGADIAHADATLVDVLNAVDYCLPALEIVDSRIADWKITISDTIADNASSGLFVLGATPRSLADLDLSDCAMVLDRNGRPESFGAGPACLGNPLNAVVWLARKMAQLERPLSAGDIVLSGALGPMVPAQPGDRFEARINGLGSVRVSFAPRGSDR